MRCKIQEIGHHRQKLISPEHIVNIYSRISSPLDQDHGFDPQQQKVVQLTSVGIKTAVLSSKDGAASDNISAALNSGGIL